MLMPMPPVTFKNESFTFNMGDEMMMTMQMSFFWGKDVVVLFDRWPGNGRLGMYILALAMVFFLAVAAELLSVAVAPNLKLRGLSPYAGAGIHAAVYGVRMGLAYLIMLSVMSFNVGIFLVAVVGHAAGCFIVKYRAFSAVARAVDPES